MLREEPRLRVQKFLVARILEYCNSIGLERVGFRISRLSANRITEFPGPKTPKSSLVDLRRRNQFVAVCPRPLHRLPEGWGKTHPVRVV